MRVAKTIAWLVAVFWVSCGADGGPTAPENVAAPDEAAQPDQPPRPEIGTPPRVETGPTESIGPEFACSTEGDCLNSCNHGAVNKAWYAEQYPGGERCEDGCTSKGTDPAQCIDGLCVAFRLGRRSEECTRRKAEVIPGFGPAHACAADDDCSTSCTYGAVNRNWYSYGVKQGSECKDGCSSKGMTAKCEDGRCVAYYMGERNDGCTGRNIHGR